MRYRASAALLVLSALSGIARADDCTDGPINRPIQTWGKDVSNGGFCHTQWITGLSVTGVEVWATQWQITGIQLTYSDGTKGPVQGQTNGDYSHDAINWDDTKPITAMKLAGNYAGDGLGLVHIEVDGKTLDVKSDVGSNTGDNVVLATGTMLGASGEAPDFVRAWRPLFMGEANGGAQITNVTFDDSLEDMNAKQQGISSVSLSEVYIVNSNPANSTNENQAWSFTGSTTKEKSSSFSTTTQNTFGLSEAVTVSVSVGVPEIASLSVSSTTTASYEYQQASTSTSENSDTQTLQWSQQSSDSSDLIEPGNSMHCTASAFCGSYDGGYTSTVQVTVNGKVYTFKQHGTFKGISWSSSFTKCGKVKAADIPAGANTTQAISSTKRAVPRFRIPRY